MKGVCDMARTSDAQVAGIIEVDTSIDLTPFITTANELVTEMCTGDNGPDTEYDATRLELIERWLAAHFYAQRDPRPTAEKAGPVGVNYQSKVEIGLDNTHYGQMAKRLDTNGGLAALDVAANEGQRRTVGITWLGTEHD